MTFIYLTLGCLLLVASSLLLRTANSASRWLSLVVFCIATACFIAVYGNIAGVFIAVPTALLIGLLTAFLLGKKTSKQ
ncbi:hypothetical protein [Pseudoalteromonas prydzensis]|uniref:Uncharacterized protein n=2 Tax=root TaxID=1 RepID=A0A7V1CVN3_9GAMM|nr:hypothetical protein [Pseudoalteromonas prydzensis]MBE0380267.1 hypothetical protein [Pseudoalteromonas prydzensis ACAM 620]HEA15181.1 hypothetical protein [Pseudoalteromonas prydzensis]